jgi:protein involved in temperature-dependent protein secretion
VIVENEYFWFPFQEIGSLRLNRLETLRDQFFVPAHLTSADGREWDVYLPALYPNSHRHADEAIRVGQGTDWSTGPDGPTLGIGLHELAFDENELTLYDFRQWE